MPLVIILLAAGGFGTWFYLSAQEKAASDARATSTAVAQANATSTSRAQANSTSTAQVKKTSTAVAQRTTTAITQATGTAEAAITATAVEVAFATMLAVEESPTVEAVEPVRMPVEDFIALYSDPAKRPLIVDVRSMAAYDAGHITGAVSIPDGETESRLSEFPKDKLIIAYCQ